MNLGNTKLVTINDETHSIMVWLSKIRITREGLRYRLNSGMSLEQALTTPARNYEHDKVEPKPTPKKQKQKERVKVFIRSNGGAGTWRWIEK